mmetsp:Transcript_17753/g.55671  ORF Transcript_17753/g.55671 Transcript_17753/m.55671 type:complete len:763 (+) Transcript_17753:70-2358(+)
MSKEHLLACKAGISKAAWQLEDAIRETVARAYPSDLRARELHIEAARAGLEYGKALLCMSVLTVFETPAWCSGGEGLFAIEDSAARCSVPGAAEGDVLLSNLPYVPPGWALLAELGLLVCIARKLYLERQLQVQYFAPLGVVYSSLPLVHFGLAMVAFETADCLFFVLVRPKWRLAFLPRTCFLCLLPAVRRLASCIFKVFLELTSIAAFYFFTVLFFAWIAATVFNDMTGTVNGEPANKGLDTFRNTVSTMFLAGSTEDFLEAFLPSYTCYRWSGFLWLAFLILAKLLLLNLVLDTLVATYLKFAEKKEEEITVLKVKGIQDAFQTLSDATGEGREVSKETFREFAKEFSRSPRIRPIPESTADIMFAAVDRDGSGLVDKREFCDICGVIEYDFWTTGRDSSVKDLLPGLWSSEAFSRFRKCVCSGDFSTFMNYVLLLNLATIVWESVWDLWGLTETPLMENVELTFSLVYVAEVGLNLSVHSWGFYWSARSNQFDFTVTWLLLASSLLDEVASTAAGADVKRYMNILRLLRLLRVLKQLKRLDAVQKMVQTISSLVTASQDILTLLGVVVFFFSALSVQLWGGLLHGARRELEGSEYRERHFDALNFNDFAMAFGAWVVSLLCEYVPALADAVARAAPGLPGSWLVLVAFYVFGVSIVFELVKAFTIEVFVSLSQNWGKGPKKEFETLERVIREFERRGLCLHYRVVGDLSTHEKVVEALAEMDEELEEEELEEEEATEPKLREEVEKGAEEVGRPRSRS